LWCGLERFFSFVVVLLMVAAFGLANVELVVRSLLAVSGSVLVLKSIFGVFSKNKIMQVKSITDWDSEIK
jgi:hypothetical protein